MIDLKKKICISVICFAVTMCLSGCSSSHGTSGSTGNSGSFLSPIQSVQQPNDASESSMQGSSSAVSESSDSGESQPSQSQPSSGASVVYFTSEITPESLVEVYNKLGWNAEGKVAVKLSTGEPPSSNYLRPELIKDLVQSVSGTIVECNTAYGGSRAQNAMHYQVAKDHGFTDIADFKILDEDGSMTLTVNGGCTLLGNVYPSCDCAVYKRM